MKPPRTWRWQALAAVALLAAGCGAEQTTAAKPDVATADTNTAETANDTTEAVINLHLRNGFLNMAHRGGGKLAPEETVVAYQNAVQLGADVIECDVHSTADGALVCIHDATVDRTTDGSGKVHGLTLAQLRALDAGYRFSQDGGQTYPFRGKGHQIATLDEFLTLHPGGGYSIEIKQSEPSIAQAVVQAVVDHGAVDQTVVISFADATMAEVRALAPQLTTGMALGEMLLLAGLSDAEEASYVPPAQVIQAPADQMDPALLVARAHRLGMKVQFWTINDPVEMKALIAAGADGILTDQPAALAEILAAP
jgi:glycerophosphoryl diester phosphodiesterase